VLEWLKRHAWKACNRLKRFGGSNPPLSALVRLKDATLIYIKMKKKIAYLSISFVFIFLLLMSGTSSAYGQTVPADTSASVESMADSIGSEASLDEALLTDSATVTPVEETGFHKALKTKFIEGDAGFMSLVALALVLGLAFCIERIIYLSLSEINAKKFMKDLDAKIMAGDIEGAKDQCRNTRGPVASICYQGLERLDESMENVERSIVSYGTVQSANLEKGCSWITLFIAMAPSLGFLGTVIGMVMAFDQIQTVGDISPTIVAAGMKVALITTIFGIIVALILQVFYNYILSKIDHLTSQMEESAITLLDSILKFKLTRQ
jgi:biopolymer transport protein ExbB